MLLRSINKPTDSHSKRIELLLEKYPSLCDYVHHKEEILLKLFTYFFINHFMKKMIFKVILLYFYFLTTAVLGIKFELDYLTFVLLYFGIPALILIIQLKSYIKKISYESLLISIPSVLVIDHIAHLSKSWYENGTINIRILNSFPIDTFIWGFIYTIFIISSYAYFFDQKRKLGIDSMNRKLIKLILSLLSIFIVLLIIYGGSFFIPYFYAVLIFIYIIWSSYWLIRFPKLYSQISLLGLFFLIPSFIYEFVAIKLAHWEFQKGFHIGYIEILNINFPLEEMLWFFVMVISIGITYEVFADNRK